MDRGRPIVDRLAAVAGLALIVAACACPFAQTAFANAPLVFDVPGLPARSAVAGIQRLNDGGALIAASAGPSRGPSSLHLLRLLADGTPDLAYGSFGVVSPALGDVHATALAVNPATAEAWIGLATQHGGGEILAVDGRGRPINAFGGHGRITLAAAPQTIAWRPGQLLVATGRSPCGGCTVALASAATGRMGRVRRLNPASLTPDGKRCSAGAVAAARFTPNGELLLGVSDDQPGCAAAIDAASPAALLGSGALSTGLPFGQAARTTRLGALGAQTCAAGNGAHGTVFGTLDGNNRARPLLRGPGGALIGVVALGDGGCSVLIRTRAGGLVLQSGGLGRMSRDAVPRSIDPLGMFRCHQHLLVLGAERHRGSVIVVVPVRRGPFATAAAAIRPGGSGCQ